MPPKTFRCKRLDLATDVIRLLRLVKGQPSDIIRCELFETYLQNFHGVPYEALSYTWGTGKSKTAILLDDQTFWVTENLYQALLALRNTSRDRHLWIYAICIDQKHDAEKGHQVGQMRRVYEKADNVLIWLGTGNYDSDIFMAWLNHFDQRTTGRADYRRNCPSSWTKEWALLLNDIRGVGAELYSMFKAALDNMLLMPWFRRVWVLQEVASPRSATIMCGKMIASTRAFVAMPSLLNIALEAHAQAVSEIMPGYLRQESWWSRKHDLSTLLKKFSNCEASQEHDMIYALPGISSDLRGSTVVRPDYEISVQQSVQKIISYLLYQEILVDLYTFPPWGLDSLVRSLDDLASAVLE